MDSPDAPGARRFWIRIRVEIHIVTYWAVGGRGGVEWFIGKIIELVENPQRILDKNPGRGKGRGGGGILEFGESLHHLKELQGKIQEDARKFWGILKNPEELPSNRQKSQRISKNLKEFWGEIPENPRKSQKILEKPVES